MDKSADAFRTISEVADHLDTPAHVLRFWESRFPQIKPVKRAGGRRYYRPSDVALLTGIKRLLHDEGLTIRGVQKILREQGVRHVSGVAADGVDHDLEGDPISDQIEGVVSRPEGQTVPFRAAPGLADAMAKAVDRSPKDAGQSAPITPPADVVQAVDPPRDIAPAQGALWLTPAPPIDADSVGEGPANSGAVDADMDRDIAALVQASQGGDGINVGVPDAEFAAGSPVVSPERPASVADTADFGDDDFGDSDFDDDDFDGGPSITLASRIRSLPIGASSAKVGAELLAVVARLQALRDAMADAAQTGRA